MPDAVVAESHVETLRILQISWARTCSGKLETQTLDSPQLRGPAADPLAAIGETDCTATGLAFTPPISPGTFTPHLAGRHAPAPPSAHPWFRPAPKHPRRRDRLWRRATAQKPPGDPIDAAPTKAGDHLLRK